MSNFVCLLLFLLLLFFSSGVNYEAFENSNVVEVESPAEEENKVTYTDEHSKPVDNRDDQT